MRRAKQGNGRQSFQRGVGMALAAMREAACDRSYVSMGSRRTASVHEFYRYPARFSPDFVRAVIEAFTDPGGCVLDPFVGGGTTLVEARLLGRIGVGSDLNELAVFLTRTKTALHSGRSLNALCEWVDSMPQWLSLRRSVDLDEAWRHGGYLRQLDRFDTWRIRNAIALALDAVEVLEPEKARLLARCAVLRTGQWALDMRRDVPPVGLFRAKLAEATNDMTLVAARYTQAARRADRNSPSRTAKRTLVINRALPGLADHPTLTHYPKPDLVLTSPPYPGVYVNYHRWKVRGRKETPAPFWIAGCPDGRGLSHYTMGARADRTLAKYFQTLEQAFADLVRLSGPHTWFVQIVGFHDAKQDLPRYLDVMRRVGLEEVRLRELATGPDGRLWRDVPGRRWWVIAGDRYAAAPHTSREVVLVHRLANS
jgi:hypothetical protein